MPSLAKAYIATIAALATVVLVVAATAWHTENLERFAIFFALAMVASAMKIRLPGFTTTISLNFVFVLMGVALFTFSETVLLGLGGAVIQSLWKTQRQPKPVQVLFNAACLTVCSGAAFWAAHRVLAMLSVTSVAAMMVVATAVYLTLNTGMVSLVVSLAERCSMKQVWPSCYEWTFPYFLIGSAMAGLASANSAASNLSMALLVLPAMYFVYVYYRMHVMRAVLENISRVSQEHASVLAGPSHSN
jgi:hypothetical protein